jgi:hypothetical protein
MERQLLIRRVSIFKYISLRCLVVEIQETIRPVDKDFRVFVLPVFGCVGRRRVIQGRAEKLAGLSLVVPIQYHL